MTSKYNNPVGSKEYNVERQRAYEKRKLAERQLPIWEELLDRVLELEKQGRTYHEIAVQLTLDEQFLIKERNTK